MTPERWLLWFLIGINFDVMAFGALTLVKMHMDGFGLFRRKPKPPAPTPQMLTLGIGSEDGMVLIKLGGLSSSGVPLCIHIDQDEARHMAGVLMASAEACGAQRQLLN